MRWGEMKKTDEGRPLKGGLHYFPIAAIKNYHKFVSWKNRNLLFYSFATQKSEISFSCLKVKILAGLIPSGNSKGKIYFLTFLSFILWCVTPSTFFKLHDPTLCLHHCIIFSRFLLHYTYQNHFDCIKPTWIIFPSTVFNKRIKLEF